VAPVEVPVEVELDGGVEVALTEVVVGAEVADEPVPVDMIVAVA
jgi:hypothetical protein